jgi:hypothetical protein
MIEKFLTFVVASGGTLLFRLCCLEALKQGKCAGTFGDVAEEMIGKMSEGAVLDLRGGEGRSDEFLG